MNEPTKAEEVESKMERARPRLLAISVLILVFVLGGVAGTAIGRVTALRDFGTMMDGPPAEARARFRMEALRRHLGLNAEQATAIKKIMDDADVERDKLMLRCEPGLLDLRKTTDERIRELLSEEQKKRLDAMDERRKRMGGRPRQGGPPPPP